MAKNHWYAVAIGRVPGVYETWDDAKAQVEGYPNAKHKGFVDYDSAKEWFMSSLVTLKAEDPMEKAGRIAYPPLPSFDSQEKTYTGNHVNVYVDGSCTPDGTIYGYGVFVDDPKKPMIFSGKGDCVAGGRNIEGEIKGATVGIDYVATCGLYDSATIYHDLQHIGAIPSGVWKAGTDYTREYDRFVKSVRNSGFALDFCHVKGHTGVKGNEYVDKLAKIGCGIPLTEKETKFVSQLKDIPGFPVQALRPLPEVPESDVLETRNYNFA